MIKMEDNEGNTIDAVSVFIPQEPNDSFSINHDKFLIFPGSKEAKNKNKKE